MAKLFHRDAGASASFGGVQIKADKDGSFDVPEEAVAELVAHGFVTRKPLPGDVEEDAIAKVEHDAVVDELTKVKAIAGELRQKLDMAIADNGQLVARVKELEAQLADAAKAKPKGK